MNNAMTPAIKGSVGSESPHPNWGIIILIASGVKNAVRRRILSSE